MQDLIIHLFHVSVIYAHVTTLNDYIFHVFPWLVPRQSVHFVRNNPMTK